MIRPSKMWQKVMLNGKIVINLMAIKNTRECDDLIIGEERAHFITPNRVVIAQNNKLYLFWFEHFNLNGYRLQ